MKSIRKCVKSGKLPVLVSTARPHTVLEGGFTFVLLRSFLFPSSLQSGTGLADEEVVRPFVSGFDDFPGIMVHEALQRTAVDRHNFIPNLDKPGQLCGAPYCRSTAIQVKDTLPDSFQLTIDI